MKKILAIFAIITIAGISTGYVHAQEPSADNAVLSDLGYVLGSLNLWVQLSFQLQMTP